MQSLMVIKNWSTDVTSTWCEMAGAENLLSDIMLAFIILRNYAFYDLNLR